MGGGQCPAAAPAADANHACPQLQGQLPVWPQPHGQRVSKISLSGLLGEIRVLSIEFLFKVLESWQRSPF